MIYLTIPADVMVAVDDDGIVREWDPIAGHYTIHHSLSPRQLRRAAQLAKQVRAGTHYAAAGHVFPVAHAPESEEA